MTRFIEVSKYTRKKNNKVSKKVVLYIIGMALIIIAIFILLKQFGIFSAIPGYVFIVIPLIVIGIGLIAGVSKS